MNNFEMKNWLPMEPMLGPPLPRFLAVYWPWYKPPLTEPLYEVGQRIYIDGEYERVYAVEWREETKWVEGGDGRVYPPQWWYFTGAGELPNWWPESVITRPA